MVNNTINNELERNTLALLSETKRLVDQHFEDRKNRGEDFNIFRIMGMESNETKTHSNMLAALLNPKGNHYQQSSFLKFFLEEINYDYSNEDLNQVSITVEHHLGRITEDYLEGGFIDILISFPSGKAIAIENKIFASDQPKQLYRYSQYKKGCCELYYLNLFGSQPSKDSLHTLTNEDFKIITYKNQIIDWLEKCLVSIGQTLIVGASIKQYLILIKFLTNSMENEIEQKLNNIILNNLEEAKYISSNYQIIVDAVKERFRNAVHQKLDKALTSRFKVRLGNDTSFSFSQIWIDVIINEKLIQFGIESFSGHGHLHGRLFVGIIDKDIEPNYLKETDERLNNGWQIIRSIKTINKNYLNLSNSKTLTKLAKDENYFEETVSTTVNQSLDFINSYQDYLKGYSINS